MPDESKFDLDFRPASYWQHPLARFARIKGELRRKIILDAAERDAVADLPLEILVDSLPHEDRNYLTYVNPNLRGGEDLPDYIERVLRRFDAAREPGESFAAWTVRASDEELS